jgi:hypothetical protein
MPAVARKSGNDSVSTGHGCDATTVTAEGSSDVRVNSIGVVRAEDKCEVHLVLVGDSCVPHTVPLTSYSGTVRANSKGIGRKDDAYSGHAITSGSGNVFAGG